MDYHGRTGVGGGVRDTCGRGAKITVGAVDEERLRGISNVSHCDHNAEEGLCRNAVRIGNGGRGEQSEVATVLCEVAGPYPRCRQGGGVVDLSHGYRVVCRYGRAALGGVDGDCGSTDLSIGRCAGYGVSGYCRT